MQEELGIQESQGDEVLGFLVESGTMVWLAKGELMLTELGLTRVEELERGLHK